MMVHARLYAATRWPTILPLQAGFGLATWLNKNLQTSQNERISKGIPFQSRLKMPISIQAEADY
jgi:hypothetical protein